MGTSSLTLFQYDHKYITIAQPHCQSQARLSQCLSIKEVNSYPLNHGIKWMSDDTLHWNFQTHSISHSMLSLKRCRRSDSGPHLHCDVF